MAGSQNIKRDNLYRLVWQQPMTKLAAQYGLSDVGLAKICRKHDIPRPPRGYWAQKEHGKAPPRSPLPNPDDDVDIQLREPEPEQPPSKVRAAAAKKIEQEKLDEMKIEVAANLENAHPLIQRARQELEGAKSGEYGLIRSRQTAPLKVTVSKDSLDRALLIMDAVIRGLELRGYVVKRGPEVNIDGVSLQFSIHEELESKREPDEKTSLDGEYEFNHSRFKVTQVPSGVLTLTIENGEVRWGDSVRRRWRDIERSRLEGRLNKFIVGLIELSIRVREYETEKKEKAEQERLEQIRAAEAERVLNLRRSEYKREKSRLNKLMTHAKNLRKCRDLRELIAAIRKSPAALKLIASDVPLEDWLVWANTQADRLDPLVTSPPSILDEPDLDVKDEDRGHGSAFGTNSAFGYGYRRY